MIKVGRNKEKKRKGEKKVMKKVHNRYMMSSEKGKKKKKIIEGVIFMQHTLHSELKRTIRNRLKNLEKIGVLRIKLVEKLGISWLTSCTKVMHWEIKIAEEVIAFHVIHQEKMNPKEVVKKKYLV